MAITYTPNESGSTPIPFSSGVEEAGLVDKPSEGGSFNNSSVGEYATSLSAANQSIAAKKLAEQAAIDTAADLVLTTADVALTHADLVLTNADVVLAEADKVQTGLDKISTNADVVSTNADVAVTNADVVLTNADVVSAEADKVQTGLDRTAVAADLVLTNADVVSAEADKVQTGLDRTAVSADLVLTNADVVSAEADKVQTGLDKVSTNADVVTTNSDVVLTNADVVLTNADVVSAEADKVQTGLDRVATNADLVLTNADVVLAEADKVQTGLDRTAVSADLVLTNADVAVTNADVVTTNTHAATATTKASEASTSETNAANSASASATSATAAQTAKTAAELAEVHAELAEVNAETAETAAELAETHADSAEAASLVSQSAAAASQSAATASANSAATSSASSASSASGAQSSEDDASISETNSASSATASANSATASAVSSSSSSSSATTSTEQAVIATAKSVIATTKASEASTSATAAQSSEDDAAADLVLTNADVVSTNADVVLTHADVVLTHADVVLAEADKVQTGLDRTAVASDLVATNQDTIDTNADLVLTNADVVLTHADVVLAEADKVQTGLDRTAVAADLVATNQDTLDTAADLVSTNADVVLTHADVVLAEADKVQTGVDRTAVAADLVLTNQDTIDTNADLVLTNADVVLTHDDVVLTHADVVSAEADKVQTGLDRTAVASDLVATNQDTIDTAADVVSTNADVVSTNADVVLTHADVAATAGKLPKSGGAMTGAITTNSTFDGRDVSVDGTKLDTIETSATADQTAAEIKALYELETSAFTDAQFTKLGGIETSATADQTAAEIRTAVEAATDSNVFTDADHTKLNAIEASADVTDTTNVVAALTAGTNVTIAVDGTVSSTDTNTTYSVGNGGLTQVNFTTADNTKLDGIEASANVTDTTNVVASLTAGTNIAIAADGTVSSTDTNTTYSVGDGGLTQVNFTTADNTKLDGISASANNYSLPASVVHDTEAGALHATDALSISGHTITLKRGDATTETVVVPDNNTVYTHPANHAISVITGLQTALNAKAPLASPALTGAPTAPTAAANTNTTQVATTAYVQTELTDLIGGAPGTLDTLNELAAAINDDSTYSSTLTTALGTKVAKASNQALSTSANAMTISGHTITLNRGDGTTDAVTVPDNNTNTHRGIDDTPVNGQTAESISSNWAFDHAASSTGHPRDTRNQIAGTYNNYSLPASVVHDTEVQALHTTDALRISGHTISLYKGNGTSESVTVPDNNDNTWRPAYSLPVATDTVLGGIELFNNTDQSTAANAVTTTASRTYGIQLNSANQAVVNVPWVDTNTDTDTWRALGATSTTAAAGNHTHNYAAASHTHSYLPLAGGTVTGTITSTKGAGAILIKSGSTLVGQIEAADTTWLRINQDVAKNIYTPRYIRADAGFFVDGTAKGINGSGNYIGGTITGASDANVSNWNTAYTHSQASHAPSNANYYAHPTTAGNKHVPTGGSAGQFLKYSASGTATWATPSYTTNTDTNTWRSIDNTPVNGVTDQSISSNWAYDHAASSTGHPRDTRSQVSGSYAASSHSHSYLPLTGGTLTGDITTNEDIISTSRDNGLFGTYSSTLTDQIWSMGTSYRNHASGTNFGNLYGLAYKHTNNTTGGTMAAGHQMVWCQNGSPKAAMGTNIWTSGTVTASGGGSANWNTAYTHSQAAHAPSNANYYAHPTGAGNNHIPSGGGAGQFLKYSSSGVATWATPSYIANTDTNTWRSISTSTSSTSTTVSASSSAVKAAYDRSWPNTTYSVGDGGLSQINFTSADHNKLNGIEASATADQTAAQLLAAIKTVDVDGSSGINAGRLNGQASTSASTASTVVNRDSAGDINARLFRSEYDSTNASCNYFMTQVDTGSNNYLRPSTLAQARAAIYGTNTITTTHIAAGGVGSSEIGNDQINSQHYVNGSIDNAHIADNAINSEHYADGSIDRVHLAADIIDGTKIANDAINSEHYVNGSIDNAHIADNAINSEHYADGSIDNAHIANGAINSEHYADNSIDQAAMSSNCIDSAQYIDASIDLVHLDTDVYEEGSWTPVIADATANGHTGSYSTIATYNRRYVKIGRSVTVSCRMTNINTSGMGTGNMYIRGLPFQADGSSVGVFLSSYFTKSSSGSQINVSVENNTTYITLHEGKDGGSRVVVDASQFDSGIADLYFSLTYKID